MNVTNESIICQNLIILLRDRCDVILLFIINDCQLVNDIQRLAITIKSINSYNFGVISKTALFCVILLKIE